MKQNSSQQKRKTKGFTLVELIVVIAILAILSAVGAVAYTGYIEHTKKGLDKQTVGEIIHAIELANYDDPSLFEKGATVYITENGVTSGNANINAALERALGDLSSIKLAYKWDLPTMSGLTNLGADGSEIDQYLDMVETDGKTASFVDDIDDLWDSVGASLEFMRNKGGIDRNFMQDTLSYVNEQKTTILEKWTSGAGFESTGGAANSASTALARNYAFAAYAKRQNLTPKMQEELDAFMNVDIAAGGNAYGIFGSEQFTNTRGTITRPDTLASSDWSDIVNSYFAEGGQAEADAQAYLAMMEAADAVGNTLGEDKSDDAFLDAMSKHLGTVKGALKDRSVLTKAISITGDFATITVNQNTDGTVTCSVNPNDEGLDPRDGNTVNGSGSTTCDKTHTETLSVLLDLSQGFSGGNNIELCSIEDHVCTVSITLKNGGGVPQQNLLNMMSVSEEGGITIDSSNLKDNGTFTVTAKTSGKVTITMAKKSFEINVNVH